MFAARGRGLLLRLPWAMVVVVLTAPVAWAGTGVRRVILLDGRWEFHREGSDASWEEVTVPAPFEVAQGMDFDGQGIYRKRIVKPRLDDTERVFLQFHGVATWARVRVNGKVVGSHLGGWTPFRCDITEVVRSYTGNELVIAVDVDERVGHNSQGFLPVFAPHFGGIWQSVELLVVPRVSIDDRFVMAVGDFRKRAIQLELPLVGLKEATRAHVRVRYRLRGRGEWSMWWRRDLPIRTVQPAEADSALGVSHVVRCDVPVASPLRWSPREPNLYEVESVVSVGAGSQRVSDRVVVRAAFRSIEVVGDELRLNGRSLRIRGLLNWGYAPPSHAPSLDESHYRRELEFARQFGFNTMKFCLWIPPKRYLRLCDEMGMLAWIEYPTWHAKWDSDQLPTLRREFAEFFAYDRNHPSVVLRSLTCETGPQADLDVITRLYRQCHAMVPGAVVEDDSSWIQWNRIHDFYDDHPYGNNHTWVGTLDRLKQYVREHGTKPLVLGECMAADTWVSPRRWQDELTAKPRPFWLPRFLEDNARWLQEAARLPGGIDERKLADDARHYALLMRKYQIETFHREVPHGGYVVSVIRDIPLCSMGLIDYGGKPKWSPADWKWHGDRMLTLETENDRRSVWSGDRFAWSVAIANGGGEALPTGRLQLRASIAGRPIALEPSCQRTPRLSPGRRSSMVVRGVWPQVDRPTAVELRASWQADDDRCSPTTNQWRIWVFPHPSIARGITVIFDESVPTSMRRRVPSSHKPQGGDGAHVTVTRQLTSRLWERLRRGAKVLLLPNGRRGSLPLQDVWFLRGGPWVARHPFLRSLPRDLLVDLQAFDLAGPVVPEPGYWRDVRPLLMLWHNHDLDHVQTHGIVFDVAVERGHLMVSALRHDGDTNAAGPWLLAEWINRLAVSPRPSGGFSLERVRQVADELREQRIDLTAREWNFRIDGKNEGKDEGWERLENWPAQDVKKIRIGAAWEGQGYPRLDGWAWYGLEVKIPDDWEGDAAYLIFQGVDDYYEVYVDGVPVGSGGDIEQRRTAFDERASHRLARVEAGKTMRIVVRVYDWYGAGGIFRPVWLSNVPYRGDRVLR